MRKLAARYRPYQSADGRPQLADAFVLSLDLLGTKTTTIEDAQRYLEVTEEALGRANQWAGLESETVVRWFSDNVALADPHVRELDKGHPSNLTFGFHLITAGWMQLELAMQGLFSRGGMALGAFYADETFVYGPALIEAYEIESTKAIYPRVVLSGGLAQHARQELVDFRAGETELQRTFIAVDRDGLPFLNYLEAVLDEPDQVREMLDNHKFHIVSRLDEFQGNPGVHLKYAWLADYHDRFCRLLYRAEHRGDLMIGENEGPVLERFASDIPIPEPPPHAGLDF